MKILWFTWKDKKNPLAGGAEIVNEELAKRLAANGHDVRLLVGGFPGGQNEEVIDGYTVIRVGNRFTVYLLAFIYYIKNLRGWADLVIDEVNTIPFFAKFYVKEKNILFIHQLAREVWFHEMIFPLSYIGYWLEPLYLRMLSDKRVVTISDSTKQDLMRYGFKDENIDIISEGIEIEPIESFKKIEKLDQPTILSLGSIRSMKRTMDIVEAFRIAKKKIANLQLLIAGRAQGMYGEEFLNEVQWLEDVEYIGPVSRDEKIELMQQSHLLVVSSVKEGWGLIVTEAASQGTPAIVYDVDGLRDSVKNGETGIVCEENTPESMAENIVKLLQDESLYTKLRQSAWEWSREINFENSYKDFIKVIER